MKLLNSDSAMGSIRWILWHGNVKFVERERFQVITFLGKDNLEKRAEPVSTSVLKLVGFLNPILLV